MMDSLPENILVGLIVAAAFAWVAWTILLPAPLRNRLRRLAGRPVPAQGGGCSGGCCGCEAAGLKRGKRC